jgi:hypothetical protein
LSHGKVTVHKGDKDGPVIGTANLQHERDLNINIHLGDHNGFISLQHHHHKIPFVQSKTTFTVMDKSYHWKGESELLEDETKDVLATYRESLWENNSHTLGRLEIMAKGLLMQDIVVLSALIVQARAGQHKDTVYL